jgi:ribonuclease Z
MLRLCRCPKITPISGQVNTTEFDYKVPNQIIYQENGATIRSYPAIHTGDGPVSYMFEYAGLKVLFSGDTVPNKWFVKYGKGVEFAIHESFQAPEQLVQECINIYHQIRSKILVIPAVF